LGRNKALKYKIILVLQEKNEKIDLIFLIDIFLMSVKISKNEMTNDQIHNVLKDCFVKGIATDYDTGEEFYACAETKTCIYTPFAYSKKTFNKNNTLIKFKKSMCSFKNEQFPFRTDGGRDQKQVFEEACKKLKTTGSVLLSLFCGYGKCLAKDTLVLLFNGTLKKVQDITEKDVVMGDDSRPRIVYNLNNGVQQLYKVIDPFDDYYKVNQDHILTLFDSKNSRIIDIPLYHYLSLPRRRQQELYGIKTQVHFPFKEYTLSKSPSQVGIEIALEQAEFDDILFSSLKIRKKVFKSIKNVNEKLQFKTREKLEQCLFLARSIGYLAKIKDDRVLLLSKIPSYMNIYAIKIEPDIIDEYYGFNLDGNGRFVLGDFTVTHNTYTGIRLANKVGLKCGILAHRDILIEQWVQSIEKFTVNAKIQRVDTDGLLDPQADFYIFNLAFVHKYWDTDTKMWKRKKVGAFKDIGTLIVDEAHVACASEMSRALLYFNPRFCIALTATPVRKDGLDKVLELYFGEYAETRIIRISQNPFTVFRLQTGIKPDFKLNAMGKKDWNSVIQSLIENQDRNEIIVNLVKKFSDYNILILTKRKQHCDILSKMLKGVTTSTIMVGTTKKYDKNARVLLSTYSKLGVGFDDERLNLLIIACSVTEIEQYAGRLRDGPNKERLIIDLVDDDSSCKSHWQQRRKWYISRKGIIKPFKSESEPEIAIPKYIRLALKN